MNISEFQEWANGKGAINPLSEDETMSSSEKPFEEEEKTGRKVYVFVFPSGRIVRVYCDEEDTIVEVGGEDEALLM